MTDIEQKALALMNEVLRDRGCTNEPTAITREYCTDEALCRAIEQHEAFRRAVSAAAEAIVSWLQQPGDCHAKNAVAALKQFIIAKPDPLVEALSEIDHAAMLPDECANALRAAMKDRGYEWRKIEGEG